MSGRTLLRATLATVAVANVTTGLTALLTPRGFYDDFPFGLGWVAELPPFNEHLTTDVGAFYLAFGLLLGWSAYTLERALVLPLCAAWSVFCLAHLGFHAAHLDGLAAADATAQTIGLVAVLAPAVLAVAVGANAVASMHKAPTPAAGNVGSRLASRRTRSRPPRRRRSRRGPPGRARARRRRAST
jgi:hypothetical protein